MNWKSPEHRACLGSERQDSILEGCILFSDNGRDFFKGNTGHAPEIQLHFLFPGVMEHACRMPVPCAEEASRFGSLKGQRHFVPRLETNDIGGENHLPAPVGKDGTVGQIVPGQMQRGRQRILWDHLQPRGRQEAPGAGCCGACVMGWVIVRTDAAALGQRLGLSGRFF